MSDVFKSFSDDMKPSLEMELLLAVIRGRSFALDSEENTRFPKGLLLRRQMDLSSFKPPEGWHTRLMKSDTMGL